jgi:hypothetical protein
MRKVDQHCCRLLVDRFAVGAQLYRALGAYQDVAGDGNHLGVGLAIVILSLWALNIWEVISRTAPKK